MAVSNVTWNSSISSVMFLETSVGAGKTLMIFSFTQFSKVRFASHTCLICLNEISTILFSQIPPPFWIHSTFLLRCGFIIITRDCLIFPSLIVTLSACPSCHFLEQSQDILITGKLCPE
jgi:hypothetical protein